MSKLDAFTKQYVITALWSETDNADDSGGSPLEANYGIEDIAPEALEQIIADCRTFQEQNAELLAGLDLETAGHDFWLTRNRHGAGFWDGDYPKEIGEKLTEASHAFGECNLYVGDDGRLYIQ